APVEDLPGKSEAEASHARPVRVGELMSRPAITVRPETPLEEVAQTMLKHRIGCVPVVGATGEPVGIITETDFTGRERGIPFSAFQSPHIFGQWVSKEELEEVHRAAKTLPAREIMSSPVITTTEDEE